MSKPDEVERLLAEQLNYYRALAPEYEGLSLPGCGGPEVAAALDAFRASGEVLELACGPGMWTDLLLRHATGRSSTTACNPLDESFSWMMRSVRPRS